MKSLVLFTLLMSSGLAFAQQINMTVAPFKAEVKLYPYDAKITAAEVQVFLQYCSASTCAGGPRVEKIVPVAFVQDESSQLTTMNFEDAVTVKGKRSGKFSTCNVVLKIYAEDKLGAKYWGQKSLIWVADKTFCSSEEAISKEIHELTKTPLLMTGIRYAK